MIFRDPWESERIYVDESNLPQGKDNLHISTLCAAKNATRNSKAIDVKTIIIRYVSIRTKFCVYSGYGTKFGFG